MKKIDPTLLNLVVEFVDRDYVIWDVGANIGLFTFSAAARAGQNGLVVALEPDVWLIGLLRRSARIQYPSSAPIHIIPAAVAQSIDLRTFHIASRSRSANYLEGYGSTQTGGKKQKQIVITLTLDWLAERFPLPDVLKLDFEGAEMEVISGASSLIENKRPIILCEVSSKSSHDVTHFLHTRGYQLYDGEVPRGNRKPLSLAVWSTIAIPA